MATDQFRQRPESIPSEDTSASWQQETASLPWPPHRAPIPEPMRSGEPPLPHHPGIAPGRGSAVLRQAVYLGVPWEHRRAGSVEHLQIGAHQIHLEINSAGAYSTHLMTGPWEDVEELAQELILFHPGVSPLVRSGSPPRSGPPV